MEVLNIMSSNKDLARSRTMTRLPEFLSRPYLSDSFRSLQFLLDGKATLTSSYAATTRPSLIPRHNLPVLASLGPGAAAEGSEWLQGPQMCRFECSRGGGYRMGKSECGISGPESTATAGCGFQYVSCIFPERTLTHCPGFL